MPPETTRKCEIRTPPWDEYRSDLRKRSTQYWIGKSFSIYEFESGKCGSIEAIPTRENETIESRSTRKCQYRTKCSIFFHLDKETLWRSRLSVIAEIGDDTFLSVSHSASDLYTLPQEEDTRYTRVEYDSQMCESVFREKSLRRLRCPANRCDRYIRKSSC